MNATEVTHVASLTAELEEVEMGDLDLVHQVVELALHFKKVILKCQFLSAIIS